MVRALAISALFHRHFHHQSRFAGTGKKAMFLPTAAKGRHVIESMRRSLTSAAFRPAVIIWLFGSALVDIMTWLIGRMPLGINFVTSVPLLVLGIGLTLVVDRVRRRFAGRPRPLGWSALALAIAVAAAAQTLADLYYLRWLSLTFFPDWQEWAVISGQRLATVQTATSLPGAPP